MQNITTYLQRPTNNSNLPGFIVLDIESASLKPNAAVLTFNASFYFLAKQGFKGLTDESELTKHSIKLAPDFLEQWLAGADCSKSTQEWHKKNNTSADLLIHPSYSKVSVKEFVSQLSDFIKGCENQITEAGLNNDPNDDFNYDPELMMIFCRHPHADWVWLESMAEMSGLKNPISHRDIYDVTSFISGLQRRKTAYFDFEGRVVYPKHDAEGDTKNDIVNILLALQ